MEDGLGIYDFRNNSFNYLHRIDDTLVRFNDGKCDRRGTIYIGTICKEKPRKKIGNIYKFKNNCLEEVITGISNSNGISFGINNEMYYSDTTEKSIYKIVNNSSKLIHKYQHEGPDGSTIDMKNRYYSCLWGGHRIDIFKDDKVSESIDLEFACPTCCCYGGINMDRLFITSAYCNKNKGYINVIETDYIGIKESIIKL